MKNISILFFALFVITQGAFAFDSVFDSTDKATEVKLAPAIKTAEPVGEVKVNTTSAYQSSLIKEKSTDAILVNFDDIQAVQRQELAEVTAKYNEALAQKQKAIQNCKEIKKEINKINKQMKKIAKAKKDTEAAKKDISQNLQSAK